MMEILVVEETKVAKDFKAYFRDLFGSGCNCYNSILLDSKMEKYVIACFTHLFGST